MAKSYLKLAAENIKVRIEKLNELQDTFKGKAEDWTKEQCALWDQYDKEKDDLSLTLRRVQKWQ